MRLRYVCVCRKNFYFKSSFLYYWIGKLCHVDHISPLGQPKILHAIKHLYYFWFWSYSLALDHLLLLMARLINIMALRIAIKWSVCLLYLPPLLRDEVIWVHCQSSRANFYLRKKILKMFGTLWCLESNSFCSRSEWYWTSAIISWGQVPSFHASYFYWASCCSVSLKTAW